MVVTDIDEPEFSEATRTVLNGYLEDETNTGQYGVSQFNQIARQVADSVQRYAISHGYKEGWYRHNLKGSLELLRNIRSAVNVKSEAMLHESDEVKQNAAEEAHFIWEHGDPELAYEKGFESESYQRVRPEILKHVVDYLQRPWMQIDILDWILVDAMVYANIVGFGEDIKMHTGNWLFLGLNKAYFDAGGNVTHMKLSKLFSRLEGALLLIGLPLGLVYLSGQYGYKPDWLVSGVTIYFILLVIAQLVIWSYRIITRKSRKLMGDRKYELWRSGVLAYAVLDPENIVMNADYVKEHLLMASKKGFVWHGAIFSMLDNTKKRADAVWHLREQVVRRS